MSEYTTLEAALTARALAQWTGGQWTPAPDLCFTGVSVDSRKITAGVLFVALRAQRDGHCFVGDALQRGAAAAMVDADYEPPAEWARFPFLRVTDTFAALQAAAAAYRRARGMKIVGVTGSAGKTSVKEMIADVLATAGPVARTQGNWNNNIGLPLSLLNAPRAAQQGVFEIGVNHPGEMSALCRVLQPDWGVITNVGPVHIEFFGTEAAIAEEKGELLRSLPIDGVAVLRADEPWFDVLRKMAPCRVVAVACQPLPAAQIYCVNAAAAIATGTAELCERDAAHTWCLRLPLPGAHCLANVLLAAAAGRAWGVEWPAIVAALEKFKPLPMRWEQSSWRGATLINDAYNANPLSMAAALAAFAGFPAPRKWLVLGNMLELGVAAVRLHCALGRQAAAGGWAGLITVGDLASCIAESACAAGFPKSSVFTCATPVEAAQVLEYSLQPGDAVLLKASRSMGLEKIVAILNSVHL